MLTRPDPSCSEVRREIEALALGEVSGADRALVLRHFRTCEPCAESARRISRLVNELAALGPPRRPRVAFRAAAAIAAALVIVIVGRTALDQPKAATPAPVATSGISGALADLLAAQSPDGAWRDPACAGSPAATAGLSGLAALGCLSAGSGDPAAEEAARHACDFLVKSLRRDAGADAGISPELALRSRAATAWALGAASRRWPDRYRVSAARALRLLVEAVESTPRAAEAGAPADLTSALIASAYGAAGYRRADEAAPLSVARLVRRGQFDQGAPVTSLAAKVLGSTLPTPDAPPF